MERALQAHLERVIRLIHPSEDVMRKPGWLLHFEEFDDSKSSHGVPGGHLHGRKGPALKGPGDEAVKKS